MTGLGRVDFSTPRLRTPKRYGFCDVLVVGGGPSGLAAALAAAYRGRMWCWSTRMRSSAAAQTAPRRRLRLAKCPQRQLHPNIRVSTDTCGTATTPTTGCRWSSPTHYQVACPCRRRRARGLRAAGGVTQQRPAGDHAGGGAQRLMAALRHRGRRHGSWCWPQTPRVWRCAGCDRRGHQG